MWPDALPRFAVVCLMAMLAGHGCNLSSPMAAGDEATVSSNRAEWQLEPVYRLKPDGDQRFFATPQSADFERLRPRREEVAFRAVCTNQWPTGLVPVKSALCGVAKNR